MQVCAVLRVTLPCRVCCAGLQEVWQALWKRWVAPKLQEEVAQSSKDEDNYRCAGLTAGGTWGGVGWGSLSSCIFTSLACFNLCTSPPKHREVGWGPACNGKCLAVAPGLGRYIPRSCEAGSLWLRTHKTQQITATSFRAGVFSVLGSCWWGLPV